MNPRDEPIDWTSPGVHLRGVQPHDGAPEDVAAMIVTLLKAHALTELKRQAEQEARCDGFHARLRHLRPEVATALESALLALGAPPDGFTWVVQSSPHQGRDFDRDFRDLEVHLLSPEAAARFRS